MHPTAPPPRANGLGHDSSFQKGGGGGATPILFKPLRKAFVFAFCGLCTCFDHPFQERLVYMRGCWRNPNLAAFLALYRVLQRHLKRMGGGGAWARGAHGH